MTVSTTTAKSGPYAGSGTTGPFTVGFRFLENSHILVVKNVAGVETNLVLDTDYTVTGAGASSGSVTLATALATGQTLTIVRNVPTTQETDYVAGDSFPAESHERALDQLTMIAQQLKEEVDRSAKLPVSSTADADALVADIVRLADSADEVDAVAGIEASVVTVAGIDSEVATVAGIAANVTTVAGVSTNVTTVAGISSNVTTVAGVAANVTTVAGVSSSVTTVAGISAAVSTVAADGTDIGAVAAISADVQAVADIATDVSAVENIAANVTTVAGVAANVTTVAGIAANVTAVAGNAININAVAANETNIDAVAGNATNINAVAADATDIGVVATNIVAVSTVATDIASVNSAAANMAAILDAPAQASAAAASAAAAAASLDNFDDRYLGSKSSAPTLDNDGNALVAGALYFNNGTIVTDDKGMWVYDGGTWIAASAASQAILVKYKYLATAGQTSFSGTDANGLTLSYTAGSIIVTLNGVVMDTADYTATTGSTVVLGTAAALNDELGVFAFSTFDIANTYTQAQADALLAVKQPINSELTAISASGNAMFKNRIINGAMVIDQRNAGASVTPTDGQYTLDRWKAGASAASKFSVQQSTTAPAGFNFSMLLTSLSAYSVGTNDNFEMFQLIEGFNSADLGWGTANAQTITIGFWARSSLTGTHGGSVMNGAFNRSYPFTYTINAANTFEFKTVTVAGDTSGTWVGATNGTGLVLCVGLGAGSGRSGTAGTWAGATYYNATGAQSLVGTSGATLYITGVQLEKGTVATSFDYRPYGAELALCQRYYQRSTSGGSNYCHLSNWGSNASTTTLRCTYPLKTSLRSAPSSVDFSNLCVDDNATAPAVTALAIYNTAAPDCVALQATVASGLTTFRPAILANVSGVGYIGISAEL